MQLGSKSPNLQKFNSEFKGLVWDHYVFGIEPAPRIVDTLAACGAQLKK